MVDHSSVSRRFWYLQFEVRFLKATGSAFQTLVESVVAARFGDEFVTVKPAGRDGDWSNDGLLREQRELLQVYAPEGFDKIKTLAKIEHDFDGAVAHWSDLFDTWVFVHNSMDGLPPYAVHDLEHRSACDGRITCDQWGFAKLSGFVHELSDDQLFDLFGPPLKREDMLGVEVADVIPLLKQIEEAPRAEPNEVVVVPQDKLFQNALSADAEELLLLGMRRAPEVDRYFQGQTQRPLFRDDLGSRFRTKYVELRATGATSDEVLDGLREWVMGPSAATTKSIAAAFAVLAFFFEQCDIFEPTSHADSSETDTG